MAIVLLIPLDVLAVYFIPANLKTPPNTSLTSFSFDKASSEIATLKEVMATSSAFGTLSSDAVNLVNITNEISQVLALKGIISLHGKDAILFNKESNRSIILKEGEKFKNWTVKSIRMDSILLTDGKNESELKIEEKTI